MRLGEFDPPEMNPYINISVDVIQSESHRFLATQAAKMSFVLLKNEKNLLPIKKKLKKVAVSNYFQYFQFSIKHLLTFDIAVRTNLFPGCWSNG